MEEWGTITTITAIPPFPTNQGKFFVLLERGLGCRVLGLGCRALGLGWGVGFWVLGLGFLGLGSRVFGFGVLAQPQKPETRNPKP